MPTPALKYLSGLNAPHGRANNFLDFREVKSKPGQGLPIRPDEQLGDAAYLIHLNIGGPGNVFDDRGHFIGLRFQYVEFCPVQFDGKLCKVSYG